MKKIFLSLIGLVLFLLAPIFCIANAPGVLEVVYQYPSEETFPLAIGASGLVVYIADYSTTTGRIVTLSASQIEPVYITGICEGIAVDASGNIYAADTNNNRIQKFSPGGELITTWGSEGSGDGQFNCPHGMDIDASGNVYVADTENSRIQKFSPDGIFLAKCGNSEGDGAGDGELSHPYGIVIDSTGNIYVADTNNNRIQKFTPDGTFLAKWGTGGTEDSQFDEPSAVALDLNGNIYVADTNNNRIQKFSPDGKFLEIIGELGQLNHPIGIAVDANGDVYVVDAGNNRIQKFSPAPKEEESQPKHGSGGGCFITSLL